MEMIQIIGLGFIVTLLGLLLRRERPELALQLSLVLGIYIFVLMIAKLQIIISLFREMAEKAEISRMYLNTILKIIGIAYVTEFGAQVCRDAGEGIIAGKIEFAGKIFIMMLAVPIILLVLNTILKLIP